MKRWTRGDYALLLLPHLVGIPFVIGVLMRLLWPLNLSNNASFAIIAACGAIVSVVITALLAGKGKSTMTGAKVMMAVLLVCFLFSFTPLFRVLFRIIKHVQGEAITFYLLFTELYLGGALLGMPVGYLVAKLIKKKH